MRNFKIEVDANFFRVLILICLIGLVGCVVGCVECCDKHVEPQVIDEPVVEEETDEITVPLVIGDDIVEIARVVASECNNEPYDGIVAVCCAIYNGAIYNEITIREQLDYWSYAEPICNTSLISDNVWKAVYQVFIIGNIPDTDVKLWFSTAGGFRSQWHENQVYLYTIGNHRFYDLKEK